MDGTGSEINPYSHVSALETAPSQPLAVAESGTPKIEVAANPNLDLGPISARRYSDNSLTDSSLDSMDSADARQITASSERLRETVKLGEESALMPHRESVLPLAFDRADLIRRGTGDIETNYEIESTAYGHGAFGSVFKAVHKATKQARAIKMVPLYSITNVDMFRNEVDHLKHLDHPNVIKLFEFYETDRHFYMVLELCTGGELFDKIVDRGVFSEREAALVIYQMLQAVNYCHGNNIMHRDLKPDNFLFQDKTDTSRIKLIDFGLAEKFKKGEVLSERAGSFFYMAPEMLDRNYTEACDAWAIGVILYILLCGYPPFSNAKKKAMQQIRSGTWEMNREDWEKVSYNAKSLVCLLLAQNPLQRITFIEALQHPFIVEHLTGQPQPLSRSNSGLSKSFTALDVLSRFKTFRRQERLNRAILGVIAQLLSENEVSDLRDTFMQLDTDQDGVVSKQDIKRALYLQGIQVNDRTLDKLIWSVDLNRSGKIDYTEFLAATIEANVHANEGMCKAAFDIFDTDKTGKISAQELSQVLGGSIHEQSLEEYESMVREVDSNDDGLIDFHDFMASVKRQRRVSLLLPESIQNR
eukprot:Platyproteum_vivax@DN2772_c0_g1_i2.p1